MVGTSALEAWICSLVRLTVAVYVSLILVRNNFDRLLLMLGAHASHLAWSRPPRAIDMAPAVSSARPASMT